MLGRKLCYIYVHFRVENCTTVGCRKAAVALMHRRVVRTAVLFGTGSFYRKQSVRKRFAGRWYRRRCRWRRWRRRMNSLSGQHRFGLRYRSLTSRHRVRRRFFRFILAGLLLGRFSLFLENINFFILKNRQHKTAIRPMVIRIYIL
jgi:hypothetical protein